MPRYRVLSPVKHKGKITKPDGDRTVHITMDEDDAAELVAMGVLTEPATTSEVEVPAELVTAFGKNGARALATAGLGTVAGVLATSDDELGAIDGVGKGTLATITALRTAD